MKQFEIRWATMPRPVGRRPVLLLSRTAAYDYLAKVIVAEVTTRIRGIPQEVRLGRRDGLSSSSVASMDNIHVIAKEWISDLVGVLRPERHLEVKRALGFALDWEELKMV